MVHTRIQWKKRKKCGEIDLEETTMVITTRDESDANKRAAIVVKEPQMK